MPLRWMSTNPESGRPSIFVMPRSPDARRHESQFTRATAAVNAVYCICSPLSCRSISDIARLIGTGPRPQPSFHLSIDINRARSCKGDGASHVVEHHLGEPAVAD